MRFGRAKVNYVLEILILHFYSHLHLKYSRSSLHLGSFIILFNSLYMEGEGGGKEEVNPRYPPLLFPPETSYCYCQQ